MKRCYPLILLPLFFIGLMACKPLMGLDPDDASPSTTDPESPEKPTSPEQEKPEPSPESTSNPASNPTTAPSPEPSETARKPGPDDEPDWKARYQEIVEGISGKFNGPKIGQMIEVKLRNDATEKGMLTGLTADTITLDVSDSEITFNKTSLAPASRVKIFKDDAVGYYAKRRVKAEKSQWENSRKMATQEKAEENVRPTDSRTGRPAKAPVNDAKDRSVWQVKSFLKGHLRDYKSTQFLKWYPVEKHKKGYTVRVRYRTKTESFGWSEERMMFFMNHSGRVYQKAPYKVTPSN